MGNKNIEYIFECKVFFQSGSSKPFEQKRFFVPGDKDAKIYMKEILIPEIIRISEKERGEKVKEVCEKKLFRIIFIRR
jgi:hypothetical protein